MLIKFLTIAEVSLFYSSTNLDLRVLMFSPIH